MTDTPQQPNTAVLNDLLTSAFMNEGDLRRFCRDTPEFPPVLELVNEGAGLQDHVDVLIGYCTSRLLFDELLGAVQARNPRMYARFAPALGARGPAPPEDPLASPVDSRRMIRDWRIWLVVGLVLVALTTTVVWLWFRARSVDSEMALEIASIPFTASAWVASDVPSELGWAEMKLVNESETARSYQLDFSLPTTATQYSGGGLAFSFPEPLDLTGYDFVEINVTFGCAEVRCSLDMRDISIKIASVPLGLGVSYDEDIEVRVIGDTQTIVIPLEEHFGDVNRAVIQDMGLSVSADHVRGYHYFIVNSIRFVKR